MDNNLFHAQMRPFGYKLSWHRNENTFGFVVDYCITHHKVEHTISNQQKDY